MNLHEKLHSLREGVGGSYQKKPSFLRTEIRRIMNTETIDNILLTQLLSIRDQLDNLTEDNFTLRLKIDEQLCNILNTQEYSSKRF
jgi:hypothetical protein